MSRVGARHLAGVAPLTSIGLGWFTPTVELVQVRNDYRGVKCKRSHSGVGNYTLLPEISLWLQMEPALFYISCRKLGQGVDRAVITAAVTPEMTAFQGRVKSSSKPYVCGAGPVRGATYVHRGVLGENGG